MTTNQLRALCVAGLLALVGVVGCSDDTTAGGDGGSTTTTSMSVTGSSAPATAPGPTITTPPASSPLLETMAPLKLADGHTWNRYQIEIFESYVRAEQAALKAQIAADPQAAGLGETHAESILDLRRQTISELRSNGHAAGAPTAFEVRPYRFSAANETLVVFYACFTSDAPIYDTRTGAVVSDRRVSTLKDLGMRKIDGKWKLVARAGEPAWEVQTCDEAYATV